MPAMRFDGQLPGRVKACASGGDGRCTWVCRAQGALPQYCVRSRLPAIVDNVLRPAVQLPKQDGYGLQLLPPRISWEPWPHQEAVVDTQGAGRVGWVQPIKSRWVAPILRGCLQRPFCIPRLLAIQGSWSLWERAMPAMRFDGQLPGRVRPVLTEATAVLGLSRSLRLLRSACIFCRTPG